MIKVRNLTFAYREEPVLDGISFDVKKGQFVTVLGANGTGKSTLFKCLLGLLSGYKGEITINGKSAKEIGRRELASLIGYVPQQEAQIYNYTVLDTVLMGMAREIGVFSAPSKSQLDRCDEILERLGILKLKNRGVNEISGGERQMTLLARALAQNAQILVMDEPTANLDYGHQHQVMRLIRELADSGLTILLSTHNPEHAVMYASHVLAIKDHHILAAGDNKETLTEELISELYGINVKIISDPESEDGGRACIPLKDQQ